MIRRQTRFIMDSFAFSSEISDHDDPGTIAALPSGVNRVARQPSASTTSSLGAKPRRSVLSQIVRGSQNCTR